VCTLLSSTHRATQKVWEVLGRKLSSEKEFQSTVLWSPSWSLRRHQTPVQSFGRTVQRFCGKNNASKRTKWPPLLSLTKSCARVSSTSWLQWSTTPRWSSISIPSVLILTICSVTKIMSTMIIIWSGLSKIKCTRSFKRWLGSTSATAATQNTYSHYMTVCGMCVFHTLT